MTWTEHQQFERDWHGDCVGCEYGERTKQLIYARKMGLHFEHDGKSPFSIDMQGKSVVDIGGGPYSMLLFCRNVKGWVVDPCEYPEWVSMRYAQAGIHYMQEPMEELDAGFKFNEALCYNCLQHVQDPSKIITGARFVASLIRIFEWLNIPPCPGHPHELSADRLDEWLGGEGKVEMLNDRERGLVGLAYYGVFKGT